MKLLFYAGFLLLLPVAARCEATDLSIITTKGYFSYSVGDDWSLVTMQTKPPKTRAVFKIPNPPDKDLPGSAKLALMTFETDSSVAMGAFNKLLGNVRSEVRQKRRYKQWEVYGRETKQGKVTHSTRFACQQLLGISVIVQINWPHLRSNDDRFGSEMDELLRTALDSVTSGIGPLPKREGGQIFKPL